jgi:hypothetical protein
MAMFNAAMKSPGATQHDPRNTGAMKGGMGDLLKVAC